MRKIFVVFAVLGLLTVSVSHAKVRAKAVTIRGVVKEVGKKKVGRMDREIWYAIVSHEGKLTEVRLFPTFWNINVPFKEGDRVKVKGWIPYPFIGAEVPVIVAAEVENLSIGKSLIIKPFRGPYAVRGFEVKFRGVIKVVKEVRGVRRKRVKWIAIVVENKKGEKKLFRVQPVWMGDIPELTPGKKVVVFGFRPPFWRENEKGAIACMIDFVESGKKLVLRRCPVPVEGK